MKDWMEGKEEKPKEQERKRTQENESEVDSWKDTAQYMQNTQINDKNEK